MSLLLSACTTTETARTLTPHTTAAHKTAYSGPRYALVVGHFDNRSNYRRGIFSSGQDPMGGQAKTILKTHLQMTNRFTLVDRENLDAIAYEAKLRGTQQQLTGARVAITGSVTEFGRKETGDQQFFGLLGRGKQQIAYAKVALNAVDVTTSEVIYAAQGAGEYALSSREVVGFGSKAGYDATLNGKVLDLAITEAVMRLVEGLDQNAWSPHP